MVDLSSMQLPRVAQTVSGVALGDLDGDGDLDVLLATGGTVSPPLLYDNDGTGVFRDLTATRIAPGTVGAAHRFLLADLDGDGDLDVLVDAPYPGTLRNDGTGSFSPWQTLPGFAEFLGNGVPASTAAVGDVDLVFGRTQRFPSPWGWMSCMRNDGTGVFNWL
ncbi:MAG: VCBS repeat-containing protein, partial [Anaerolineae bacterium]|nr:VCBS repeat-containing protein [Anaerolineae bacterium]